MDLVQIKTAWQAYIRSQELLPGISTTIAGSWQRCRPLVNPQQPVKLKKLGEENMRLALGANERLISIARPVMEDIHQYIEHTNTVIALINGAGHILDICGDPVMLEEARARSIDRGALVAESHMGTNAFGIPLFGNLPVRTIGAEHYVEQFHDLAMTAAPIFTGSGRLIGILGTVCMIDHYHPHSLGLAVAGARAIEGQLESANLLDEKNAHLTELNKILASMSEGIVVCDQNGVVTHANPRATNMLQLSERQLQGRPLLDTFQFPAAFVNACHNMVPLSDLEISLKTRSATVTCIVSTRFVQQENQPRWMIMTLREAEEFRRAVSRQIGVQMPFKLDDFPGESVEMRSLRKLARSAAFGKASILLRGESGTGKNLFARAIHLEGDRRDKPFIIFSCASIPNEIMLKELLGFEGAEDGAAGGRPSKFELGHTGTIYFQDVDQLPLEAQAALLTVVDFGVLMRLGSARTIPVDVRIIASTSVNIEQKIAQGNFRADLYYRLSSYDFRLPPLRDRSADLPLLIEKICARISKSEIHVAPGTINALQNYSWPGNIRELEACLERAITQSRGSDTITLQHFPKHIREPITHEMFSEYSSEVRTIRDVERETIIQAARRCNGNVSLMAERLGISRSTVWRKMKALNISADQFKFRALNEMD